MDEKIKIEKKDLKIRKDWGNVSPETKIHKVKTEYSRSSNKKAIEEALQEAEENDLDLYDLDLYE